MKRLLVLCIAVLISAGCRAPLVRSLSLSPENREKIESIAVIEVVEPTIEWISYDAKSSRVFIDRVAAERRKLAPLIQQLYVNRLAPAGYQVSIAPRPTESLPGPIDDFAKVATSSDAILELYVEFVGYTPDRDGFLWPDIDITHRLFDRRSGELVFAESVLYGHRASLGYYTRIKPDEQYRYTNAQELLADPTYALDALERGLGIIVARIGSALEK